MVENTENNERIVNRVETLAVLYDSIWKPHTKWSAEGSNTDNDAIGLPMYCVCLKSFLKSYVIEMSSENPVIGMYSSGKEKISLQTSYVF